MSDLKQKHRAEEESQLIVAYRHLVPIVARSISRAAIKDEDALQSGLIGLWEAAQKWDRKRPFAPLARRCIRCNILDYLRGRQEFDALPENIRSVGGLEERIEEDWVFRALILRSFPRRSLERRAILLFLKGHTKTEVARRMHISRSTVYRLSRRIWKRIQSEKEAWGQ